MLIACHAYYIYVYIIRLVWISHLEVPPRHGDVLEQHNLLRLVVVLGVGLATPDAAEPVYLE